MSGAHLKSLYTNAHSMGNEQEESEVCLRLQDYDLFGITEMWWDGSHSWSVAIAGYRHFRKNRPEWQGCAVALYVTEQQGCMVPCLGTCDEPAESLWLGVRQWANKSDVVMIVCYSKSIS